ncbi:hypothetical protein A2U01_0022103, partial [Trifolium medium]|nr:hypothetical protein [Trifolium medium]
RLALYNALLGISGQPLHSPLRATEKQTLIPVDRTGTRKLPRNNGTREFPSVQV